MEFKYWFELYNQSLEYIKDMKKRTLSSMKIDGENAFFKFPKPQVVVRQELPTNSNVPTPMNIAAHTIYTDPLVEGIGHGDPYGKGSVALNTLKKINDPNWTGRQEYDFKRIIKNKLKNIGGTLGLLFELEVFNNLISLGLKSNDDQDIFWFESLKNKYLSSLEAAVGNNSNLLIEMIKTHADSLAKEMLDLAKRNLKCLPVVVEFHGGMNNSLPSSSYDIVLSCKDKNEKVPYSLKFSSETRINVAEMSYAGSYELLGGIHTKTFLNDVNNLKSNQEKIGFVIETLADLAANMDSSDFAKTINYLITRNEKTLTAFKNYVTGMGGAGFSNNISKDFKIKSNKLYPKDGAKVFIRTNPTYLAITYKVENGTPHGTQIYIEPTKNTINFKINNLVSN